jgi:hypothetical protein
MNDERIIVLVCYDCHKLIGTRENYFVERRQVNRGNHSFFHTVAICEGCHNARK